MVLEEEGIDGGRDRGGGCGAAGWEGTGAGEDGAENREDGEPRLLAPSLRIGVDGYATFNNFDKTMWGEWLTVAIVTAGRETEEVLGIFLGGSPDLVILVIIYELATL